MNTCNPDNNPLPDLSELCNENLNPDDENK